MLVIHHNEIRTRIFRMDRPDNFNEIASALLLTDAELGLTFVRIAVSYPEGERRRMVIQRAEYAYRRISELTHQVQMTEAVRMELEERLEKLRAAIQEADSSGSAAVSA